MLKPAEVCLYLRCTNLLPLPAAVRTSELEANGAEQTSSVLTFHAGFKLWATLIDSSH